MKNEKENAFPVVLQHGLSHDSHVEIGLTKLEYASIIAMQGILTMNYWDIETVSGQKALAEHSIGCAKELLKKLEENENNK